MRSALYVIACVMLQASGIAQTNAWQRAEIYFIDWDIETFVALSPEQVRQQSEVAITIRTNVLDFVHSLAIDKLRRTKDARPEDARLVIDLFSDSGRRVTYYASRFDLCTTDNTMKRPIDGHFRDRFRQMAKHFTKRPNTALEPTPTAP